MGPKKGKAIVLSSDSSGVPTDSRKRKAIKQSDSSSDEQTPNKGEKSAEEEKHDNKSGDEQKEDPGDVTLATYMTKTHNVAIAPAFQVDVPDVTEVTDLKSYRDATEDSKWLGTRVWPVDDNADDGSENAADIGQGRSSTNCSCRVPGSERCVRLHVTEKREQLRHQLGPAFEAWGFNEMGEDVAKSWETKQEKLFKILVSGEEDILQPELPCKVDKTYKEMVSYYFNVLVLRRVNAQARRGDPVDTDDDTYVDKRRKTRVSQAASASSKFLKPLS